MSSLLISFLGLVNVALLYNTFRVLSPVFHGLTLPKIQVDTEKSFGNDEFNEFPILPPPAHKPKGPLLPLFTKDDKSQSVSVSVSSVSVSPLSLSEFPEVKQHSRNSSSSSADSTTHLLSIKRKPSRYHSMRVKQDKMQALFQTILPTAELNRQLGNLQLDLPVAEVNTAKPTLETVSLSPAPRSAVASVLSPSPIASTPAKSANTSPMRQITLAFGRPKRKSKFGPRSKGGVASHPALPIVPPLSPIPSVDSPKSMSEGSAARSRESSTSLNEGHRPPQLDLTGVTSMVPVRPLPAITAEVERVDKGKDRAPTPPMPLLVQKDVTSWNTHSGNGVRPLPQFPRNSAGSLSSDESSHHPDDSLLSVTSFLSLSSPHPSLASAYSSNASVEGARGKDLPAPPAHDDASEEEGSTQSELSSGSRRMTQTSIWSQESPMTASQPPDMEAALAQLLARARS